MGRLPRSCLMVCAPLSQTFPYARSRMAVAFCQAIARATAKPGNQVTAPQLRQQVFTFEKTETASMPRDRPRGPHPIRQTLARTPSRPRLSPTDHRRRGFPDRCQSAL